MFCLANHLGSAFWHHLIAAGILCNIKQLVRALEDGRCIAGLLGDLCEANADGQGNFVRVR